MRLQASLKVIAVLAMFGTGLAACGSEEQTAEKKDAPAASSEQAAAPAAAPEPAAPAAPSEQAAAPAAAPEPAPAAAPEPAAPAAEAPAATAEAPAAAPAAAPVAPAAVAEAPAAEAPAATAEATPPPASVEASHSLTVEELAKLAQDGKKFEGGKWVLPDGSPTYDVQSEGSGDSLIIKQVDWNTYSGWRRYHAECHVCHGPNGDGSSFAPALTDSLKTMDYAKFMQVVASGQRRNVGGTDFIMPALGDNKNVMCYIDDLYIYLRARSTGALPGGRLSADQRAEKPPEAKEAEEACLAP